MRSRNGSMTRTSRALTDQMEKKRQEIEEAERRLRNKDGDINDAQRERQHFTSRLVELAEERARQDERNRQIDADIAGSNEQISHPQIPDRCP